jgi:hypothetical protein
VSAAFAVVARAWRGPCALAALLVAEPARAHGFGQRYDLPIPLSLYLAGAALTVALSCFVLALWVRATPASAGAWSVDLLRRPVGRALASRPVVAALRLAVAALFALVIVAGLCGAQSPFRNIAPVMVWAVWWVGMAYVSALVGDVWAIVNPLDTIFGWAETLHARWRPGKPLGPRLNFPERLGVWPAVAFFLAFLWMELAWEASDHPASLAAAMLGYSILTWIAMYGFGRAEWLAHGEVFARVFGVLARFAPLEIRVAEGRIVEWKLRPYAIGLLAREPVDASEIALVLVMLAAVSLDGFMETPAWAATADAIVARVGDGAPEDEARVAMRSLGLLVAPLLFFAVYALFCRLIAWFGAPRRPQGDRARGSPARIRGLFVLTLVPIAIAYQVAHYLSFLAMAGQYLIPLASDPLGLGWNLFGTKNYFARIGLVDARLVWFVSVGAIVAGHIAALFLGHLLALREFDDRRAAIRSQMPMLVLMVGYTMLSLWIIAQPIVTSRFG